MSLVLNFLTMIHDMKYILLHEPLLTYKYISLYKNEKKKLLSPYYLYLLFCLII